MPVEVSIVRRQQTYRTALTSAAGVGLGTWIALSAGQHATVMTAVPYALAAAAFLALVLSAMVAYSRR